ncbi:hypothetical protein DdX_11515 [Ditylenchus destructor]|uniref:Uncharacterized protein n=1 Tax=Ditylenchus destructor TaxID=166010 RepID=A0AAD4N0M6_9BILA|nr:hypothetical protein DdX_11515 [Ditylenchus destructor]
MSSSFLYHITLTIPFLYLSICVSHSERSRSHDARRMCVRIHQHAMLASDLCRAFHHNYHVDLSAGGVQRYGRELIDLFNNRGRKHVPPLEAGRTMIVKSKRLLKDRKPILYDPKLSTHSKECIRNYAALLKEKVRCLKSNVNFMRYYDKYHNTRYN